MEMKILERDDNITHVVLSGRLDTTGAEAIGESFSNATGGQRRPAIIDLSEIAFLASRGIGLLFTNGKTLMQAGQKLVLLNPRGMVESVLKISRVEKLMPIAYDLDEAVAILQGGQATGAVARRQPASAVEEAGIPQPSGAPSPVEGSLKLAIKNELSELEDLNATLAQFLADHHVPHRAGYAVNLAIDELVVNVMRYAYIDDQTHIIDIELAIEGDQVILRIVDDGRPFDPRRGPALDLHAEDREAGGLGLILVLDLVDALKYRRVDEKNCVEVGIHLFKNAEGGDPFQATGDLPEASDL